MNNLVKVFSHKRILQTGSLIKPVFCVFWALVILLMMLCSLAILKISISDKRSDNLSIYNKAVEEWKATYKEDFSDLQILPYVGDLNDTESHQLLKQLSDSEKIEEDDHGKLPDYDPLFYEESFPDVSIFALPSQIEFDEDRNLTLSLQVIDKKGRKSHLAVDPIPLFQVERKGGRFPSGCDYVKGYYSSKSLECHTFWQLVGCCIKLRNDTEKWTIDYETSEGCSSNQNQLGIYQNIPANRDHLEPDKTPEFQTFKVRVRSSHDPLIKLREITDGTLNLGLPQGVWIALGVILLLVSVYSFIHPVMYFLNKARGVTDIDSPKLVEFGRLSMPPSPTK